MIYLREELKLNPDMRELIKEIQKKWAEVKLKAQRECENNARYDMASKLSLCSMFRGDEDLEALCALMFTPQGAEFLTTYNFPDLSIFRKFKRYHPERYGIYIDSGKIAISEPKKAFLVGNTIATIKCAETAGNRIIAMCGATAIITASGYSVVKIEKDTKSKVTYTIQDHAKVLI